MPYNTLHYEMASAKDIRGQLWWAQKFADGSVYVKPYAAGDVEASEMNPAVDDTWGPYEANNYQDAVAEAEQVLC